MLNIQHRRVLDQIPNPDILRIRILKRTTGSIQIPGSGNHLKKVGRPINIFQWRSSKLLCATKSGYAFMTKTLSIIFSYKTICTFA